MKGYRLTNHDNEKYSPEKVNRHNDTITSKEHQPFSIKYSRSQVF